MAMSDRGKQAFDGAAFARTLRESPGVYMFRDRTGKLLYVGKARNLRRRVASYFDNSRADDPRLARMVPQIARIEVELTRTEAEALLLENEWIKSLRPRYNIKLRDDKSYPFIYLSSRDTFPRVAFHRGARDGSGEYFGPFPSARAVRETLKILHRVFRLRMCEDSVFENRSRPCLQYQIARCSAPCVGLISSEAYRRDVELARLFLSGKSAAVQEQLTRLMREASAAQNYERAAGLRDQLRTLSRVQAEQYVTAAKGDMDLIASHSEGGVTAVQVWTIRDGRNLGSRTFFPANTKAMSAGDLMAAFLGQYYHTRQAPREVLLDSAPAEPSLWREALTERAGHAVTINAEPRGQKSHWLAQVRRNARDAVRMRLSDSSGMSERLAALQAALESDEPVERIECFDVSHSGDGKAVASCVVHDETGLRNDQYRRFNISGIEAGDDYAAIAQALTRRYRRVLAEGGSVPDLVIVDGGLGQVRRASSALNELGLDGPLLMGVAKGRDRRASDEYWVLARSERRLKPDPHSAAAHLVGQVRDEAHRFAISGHRRQRSKRQITSVLEGIPGVGPQKRRQLLQHFGGLQGVRDAGAEELTRVKGINTQLAQRIVAALRD